MSIVIRRGASNIMVLPVLVQELIDQLSQRPEVEALVLAGAHGRGSADAQSDYDFYCYLNSPLAPPIRQAILAPLSSVLELNNAFWETEDDGLFSDGVAYEILYRDLAWLDAMVERVAFKHQAETGYSTCFWANLNQSQILFDRQGAFAALQHKYALPYPAELQRAIIAKNWPLLTRQLPAYSKQLEKAFKRADRVSINHRLAAFLASYFDILFAANARLHPGEKKLLAEAAHLPLQPKALMLMLNRVLDAQLDPSLLEQLHQLTEQLALWLVDLDLLSLAESSAK